MHGMITDVVGLAGLVLVARLFLMDGGTSLGGSGVRGLVADITGTAESDTDGEDRRTDEYFRGHEYGDRESWTRDLPREPGELPW